MEAPKDTKVYETKTGKYWFDNEGILYSVSNPNPPKLSKEESMEEMNKFLNLFGDEKRCILIDAKHAKPNTPEERKQAAETLPKVTKAMAIIVHNALGRMVVNLFIGLEKPKYPMKIFKPDELESAKEWLRQYL